MALSHILESHQASFPDSRYNEFPKFLPLLIVSQMYPYHHITLSVKTYPEKKKLHHIIHAIVKYPVSDQHTIYRFKALLHRSKRNVKLFCEHGLCIILLKMCFQNMTIIFIPVVFLIHFIYTSRKCSFINSRNSASAVQNTL